jgi:F-type H+-transporting ATPase subunit epsilon
MRLSVTTPRGSLVETDVDEITAPGALGEFGILPGHIPFVSALKPGVFVYRSKGDVHVLAVGEGVLEVTRTEQDGKQSEKIIVLVSEGVRATDVDRPASAKEVADADNELQHWNKEVGGEYKALLLRRAFASARVDAASRAAPH